MTEEETDLDIGEIFGDLIKIGKPKEDRKVEEKKEKKVIPHDMLDKEKTEEIKKYLAKLSFLELKYAKQVIEVIIDA